MTVDCKLCDFPIEIVSESDPTLDYREKLPRYREARIDEIGIVDPFRKRVRADVRGGRGYATKTVVSGRLQSAVIPGFWINVAWLWRSDLPPTLKLTRRMNSRQQGAPSRPTATPPPTPLARLSLTHKSARWTRVARTTDRAVPFGVPPSGGCLPAGRSMLHRPLRYPSLLGTEPFETLRYIGQASSERPHLAVSTMHSPGRLKAELQTSPDRSADGAALRHWCPAGRFVGKAKIDEYLVLPR